MSERRTAWLLLLLLLGQLLLVAGQVPGSDNGGSLLETAALRIVAPVGRSVDAVVRAWQRLTESFRGQRAVLAENRNLEAEIVRLRRELFRLRNVEDELERLAEALDYARFQEGELQVANIVYSDVRSTSRTLVLFVGEATAQRNQPVVAPQGLVGRVVTTAGSYAKVQLVTDRSATVGAMIERTRRQGLVRGTDRSWLELDYVPLQADVTTGDRVVTSGIDGVYPRGLAVGTITSVEPGSELFHRIRLRPAVDFSRLDQVYLMTPRRLPAEMETEGEGAHR